MNDSTALIAQLRGLANELEGEQGHPGVTGTIGEPNEYGGVRLALVDEVRRELAERHENDSKVLEIIGTLPAFFLWYDMATDDQQQQVLKNGGQRDAFLAARLRSGTNYSSDRFLLQYDHFTMVDGESVITKVPGMASLMDTKYTLRDRFRVPYTSQEVARIAVDQVTDIIDRLLVFRGVS